MEFVAEPLLSASVETLFKMLGSSELIKFAREKKIDAELNKWETTLRRINGLLHDAEEKQLTHEGVKIWFANLQHLAYDIEDVLDEFGTETLKRKVMKDKLRKLVSSSCCSFAFKRKMASGIEHITARLEDIAQQEQSLNLLMNATGTRSKQLKEWPPTTSLVNKSYFYGRNDEKEAIVQKLLKDEVSNNPISVFAIVGMGGIGKTTLAQQVYNHDAIKNYFDIKVWVCVSENFDVDGLTRTILWKVAPETRDLKDPDLDSLQQSLKGKLSKKKFLLILDDIWEEDYSLWDQLRTPFFSAASRSKIIVTTRKNNAAPIRDDVHVYRVKELPNDDCLCLLASHALAQSQSQSHLEHLEIWGCQRLTAVTPGKFPAALKFLKMLQCSLQLESPFSGNNKALETIVITKNNNIKALPSIDCLPNLKELYISDCPALESFPEMGFLSTSLQNLVISDCQNLPLPPILMQSHFPSLRELMISNCPNVASLVGAGGVPQNLTTLEISYCEKLRQPIAEWGLGMLSSLETLEVSGRCPATSDVKLLPDDNCWLPTSLKTLYINNFINLESVSMGLRRLTSLEDLHIRYCPKLRSLPKGALPFSVKKMYIGDCPLLKEDDFSEREGLFVKYYEGALE